MDSNRLTTLGIDNTGKLVLTYGQEDSDFYIDDDPSSGYVYRAAESTFFCRVRDLFPSELQAMFVDRENANAWSADGLISQWDKAQSEFPEELWRLDIQRKYLRTYQGISVDNSIEGTANPRFLTEMLNGRKKYQRRMFERNQELYMATKYFGNRATQDQIMMRFNNPVGVPIKPEFTLKITPYSNMYIGVKFGNFTAINIRAKAGIEYTIPYTLDTADITLIYGASFIQAIGDLSKCYVGDNDFSKASRMQSLIIGSDVKGYENTYMTKISMGNNALMEYLDVRNVTGLNSVIDLSECNNLLELHAEGSGATGVIFSNGGKLKKAYLPSIASLTVKNLNNLEVFDVESYDNLLSLIVENTPFINTLNVVNAAKKLNIVRLIGIDWSDDDTDVLDRMLTLRGIGNDGFENTVAMLTGKFYATVMRQKKLEDYQKAWKNLILTYGSLINQFTVQFLNDNGDVLDTQYVDKGEKPVDPIKRKENPIAVPTKESTVSTVFTFKDWNTALVAVFANQTYMATYTEKLREYTVKYLAMGEPVGEPYVGGYGTYAPTPSEIPAYTGQEQAFTYYLFTGWDKSGYINGDKEINAVYDSFAYSEGCFDGKELADMRPVEIYALSQVSLLPQSGLAGLASKLMSLGDTVSVKLGHDYEYSDIESKTLISEKTLFTGENYIDTEIPLLTEDKDFVLAIDYKFDRSTPSSSVLMQCYQSNGRNGFQLWNNNGSKVSWGTSSTITGAIGNREIIVLRHVRGENGLHVYASNLSGNSSTYIELTKNRETKIDATLVFGCVKADDGYTYENYATGEIHWCKLWYSDLGDSACKELVSWIHEEKQMKLCNFSKYYLSDNASKRAPMTFIAENLLDQKKSLGNTSANSGGYAQATLPVFLDNRLYKAFSYEWQQVIRKVQVSSSVGDQSQEVSSRDSYIYVPSAYELDSSFNYDPYSFEGSNIPFILNDEDRICKYADGTTGSYWTRSPNFSYSGYWYRVEETGLLSGYYYGSNADGIRVMFSV